MKIIRILILVCSYLIFTFCINAQTKINYKKSDGLLDITPYISYLADSTGKLTFEQMRNLRASAFKPNKKAGINLGSTNYPHWFKIEFGNSIENKNLILQLENGACPVLDAYLISQSGTISNWQAGVTKPFGQSYFEYPKPNFSLGTSPKIFYLRVIKDNMHLLINVADIKSIIKHNHNFDLFFGGLILLMLGLAIYNLILFISIKDSTFIFYSIHVLALCNFIFMTQGFHHQYFLKNNSFANNNLPIFIILSNCCTLLFVIKFLNTKSFAPIIHKILILISLIAIVLIPLHHINGYVKLILDINHILLIIHLALILYVGLYIWKLGYNPAKYFVFSWSFFIIGAIVRIMGSMEILPISNFWVYNSWYIGVGLETLLMAFAVAYRFNLFRQEARDAQALVLQRSGENEQLLLAHNQILEEKLQLEEKINSQKPDTKVDDLLERLQSERGKNKKLAVSTIEGVLLLPIPDIIRLEALGSYCNIYLTHNKKIIASKNLAEFEPLLDKSDFLRTHKSHIVNLNFVERYIRGEGGMVIMPDGAEVSVSRTMKAELLEKLNIS